MHELSFHTYLTLNSVLLTLGIKLSTSLNQHVTEITYQWKLNRTRLHHNIIHRYFNARRHIGAEMKTISEECETSTDNRFLRGKSSRDRERCTRDEATLSILLWRTSSVFMYCDSLDTDIHFKEDRLLGQKRLEFPKLESRNEKPFRKNTTLKQVLHDANAILASQGRDALKNLCRVW